MLARSRRLNDLLFVLGMRSSENHRLDVGSVECKLVVIRKLEFMVLNKGAYFVWKPLNCKVNPGWAPGAIAETFDDVATPPAQTHDRYVHNPSLLCLCHHKNSSSFASPARSGQLGWRLLSADNHLTFNIIRKKSIVAI